MSQLMPEPLATWSWRLERVRSGRTVLTRAQATTARMDLVNDRAAHAESYEGYEEEFASALDALDVLSRQPNRQDDLLSVLAAERRTATRQNQGAPEQSDPTVRSRASLAAEHDRVPRGLPQLLDQWVHRLIRYRGGAKLIDPIEAARAEIRLRNEADLESAAYRHPVAAAYLSRTLRELGEIATSQRGGHDAERGLHRGIAGVLV
jgi:hypothetical protein